MREDLTLDYSYSSKSYYVSLGARTVPVPRALEMAIARRRAEGRYPWRPYRAADPEFFYVLNRVHPMAGEDQEANEILLALSAALEAQMGAELERL